MNELLLSDIFLFNFPEKSFPCGSFSGPFGACPGGLAVANVKQIIYEKFAFIC
jgi:hypothetical protein